MKPISHVIWKREDAGEGLESFPISGDGYDSTRLFVKFEEADDLDEARLFVDVKADEGAAWKVFLERSLVNPGQRTWQIEIRPNCDHLPATLRGAHSLIERVNSRLPRGALRVRVVAGEGVLVTLEMELFGSALAG